MEALSIDTVEHATTRGEGISQRLAFVGVAGGLSGLFLAAGAPSPIFRLEQKEWGFPVWVLTIAFSIYAVALLLALLVAGSLSDYLGRRPVLIGALAVEAAAMIMFLFAPDIGWVIAARAVQGAATGAAASAFTAAVVEYAPPGRARLGAVAGSVAPAAGLGVGALFAGLVIQFTDSPSPIIFASLSIIFAFAIVVLVLSPETVPRRPGAVRSLIPRVLVPRAARREFYASVPVHVAVWMLGGLYLGLVPLIMHAVFHVDSGLVNGVAILGLSGVGAVTGIAVGGLPARAMVMAGGCCTTGGTVVVLCSVWLGSMTLFFVGTVIAGIGFGASFSGALRAIGPLAPPRERAALFAAVYIVSYLAFSIPVVAAGLLVSSLGVVEVTIVYCLVVVAAGVLGLVGQDRLRRRGSFEVSG